VVKAATEWLAAAPVEGNNLRHGFLAREWAWNNLWKTLGCVGSAMNQEDIKQMKARVKPDFILNNVHGLSEATDVFHSQKKQMLFI
jgi:hypothetical protein